MRGRGRWRGQQRAGGCGGPWARRPAPPGDGGGVSRRPHRRRRWRSGTRCEWCAGERGTGRRRGGDVGGGGGGVEGVRGATSEGAAGNRGAGGAGRGGGRLRRPRGDLPLHPRPRDGCGWLGTTRRWSTFRRAQLAAHCGRAARLLPIYCPHRRPRPHPCRRRDAFPRRARALAVWRARLERLSQPPRTGRTRRLAGVVRAPSVRGDLHAARARRRRRRESRRSCRWRAQRGPGVDRLAPFGAAAAQGGARRAARLEQLVRHPGLGDRRGDHGGDGDDGALH